jgi:hypothetical protein
VAVRLGRTTIMCGSPSTRDLARRHGLRLCASSIRYSCPVSTARFLFPSLRAHSTVLRTLVNYSFRFKKWVV